MNDRSTEPHKQPSGITLTPERRQHPRYRVHLPLELRVEGSDVPIRLETADVSRNGCYIETNMPFSVGTQVEAKLWLGETRILVRGRIVTCHPQFGNGIMFLVYDGDSEQRLRAFLDAIPPV
jgi:hypothetical protein